MKKHGNTLKEKLYNGHLWNPSYYIATVSENTEQQIKEYIQKQKTNDRINNTLNLSIINIFFHLLCIPIFEKLFILATPPLFFLFNF